MVRGNSARVTAMTPLFQRKKEAVVTDETHKISYVSQLVSNAGLSCAAVIAEPITKFLRTLYRLSVRNATK